MGRIFGTDGVRGQANTDVTPELALKMGRAVVRVLQEEGERRPGILVGRDPRWSGDLLLAALTAGITSAGGDVIDLGVLPTPAVAYLAAEQGRAGAMISASHNPVADNGIKFFGRDGFKLTDAEEDRLEALLDDVPATRPTGTDVGRAHTDPVAVERYLNHLVETCDVDLSGLRIVVDAADGAASAVAPEVYRRLGAEVVALHAEPDGANINVGCGSTHPEVIREAVLAHGADVGIAHDGDADRLICADATGTEVDGDVILAILARQEHARARLRGDAVATTVMTNLGFHQAMAGLGIKVITTAVGDRYVLEAMRERALSLGGEQSGHLILLDHATTGDGVLSAVQLLATMRRSEASLAELATVMARLPQVLVNVRGVDKDRLDDTDAIWSAVADVERELGDSGRVLVRKSGTEPLVRVMVEAATSEHAQGAADRIAEVVAASL